MHKPEAPLSWAISIVSHGHGKSIVPVMEDIHRHLQGQAYRIILTQNIAEPDPVLDSLPADLRKHVVIRKNPQPQGFGANHNAALLDQNANFVATVDPDLALPEAIFPALAAHLQQPGRGVASPRAVCPQGQMEDNGRPLLTPARFIGRNLFGRQRNRRRNIHRHRQQVDWLAGLFLAMPQSVFRQVGGFDTRYFMYCEDIDLCLRIQQLGLSCELLPEHRIVHPARRATFRSARHLLWHIRSLLRLWRSASYQQFRATAAAPRPPTRPADK